MDDAAFDRAVIAEGQHRRVHRMGADAGGEPARRQSRRGKGERSGKVRPAQAKGQPGDDCQTGQHIAAKRGFLRHGKPDGNTAAHQDRKPGKQRSPGRLQRQKRPQDQPDTRLQDRHLVLAPVIA